MSWAGTSRSRSTAAPTPTTAHWCSTRPSIAASGPTVSPTSGSPAVSCTRTRPRRRPTGASAPSRATSPARPTSTRPPSASASTPSSSVVATWSTRARSSSRGDVRWTPSSARTSTSWRSAWVRWAAGRVMMDGCTQRASVVRHPTRVPCRPPPPRSGCWLTGPCSCSPGRLRWVRAAGRC